jgi:flagellar basal-body rod modification protein FlgD
MTSIDAVTGTIKSGGANVPSTNIYSGTGSRAPKQTMDSDMFMQLLVTQLKNQDPSSPMDTNQMISQTTQMAMMEKLTNMDTTGTEGFALQMRVAAASLIGQQVSYVDPQGNTVTGKATSVSFVNSVPTVSVNGVSVPLDSVSAINPQATA